MQLDPQEMRPVINRLKRARGQLDVVITQLEQGHECSSAVHGVATVSGALDRAGFAIIFTAMRHALEDPEMGLDGTDLDELQKLFLSLS